MKTCEYGHPTMCGKEAVYKIYPSNKYPYNSYGCGEHGPLLNHHKHPQENITYEIIKNETNINNKNI